jgi:hypothetical protein
MYEEQMVVERQQLAEKIAIPERGLMGSRSRSRVSHQNENQDRSAVLRFAVFAVLGIATVSAISTYIEKYLTTKWLARKVTLARKLNPACGTCPKTA